MQFGFKRKKVQKESHIATTPETSQIQPSNKKRNIAFLLWNILSIGLYLSYTLFVIYKLSETNFLSKIIIYLLVAYAIAFILLVIISIGNRTKLKYRLKSLQSAANFFKYFIQILNFVLSIITAISAFITTGTTDISAIMYAILSLAITLIFIIVEIAKIIIRKNIPLIKYNFLEIRDKLPNNDNRNKTNKNMNTEISVAQNSNNDNNHSQHDYLKENFNDEQTLNNQNQSSNKNKNQDNFDDFDDFNI